MQSENVDLFRENRVSRCSDESIKRLDQCDQTWLATWFGRVQQLRDGTWVVASKVFCPARFVDPGREMDGIVMAKRRGELAARCCTLMGVKLCFNLILDTTCLAARFVKVLHAILLVGIVDCDLCALNMSTKISFVRIDALERCAMPRLD